MPTNPLTEFAKVFWGFVDSAQKRQVVIGLLVLTIGAFVVIKVLYNARERDFEAILKSKDESINMYKGLYEKFEAKYDKCSDEKNRLYSGKKTVNDSIISSNAKIIEQYSKQ